MLLIYMEILKDPLYNSIFSGIIIYILINISNKGDPVLGAILSSLPIGLFGLMAIKKKENIQKFYIRSELFTNFTIILMWITINILINYTDDTNKTILIGFSVWIIMSFIFYYFASKYFKKIN